MNIKDQIMKILSFDLHDTTFDEYANEFGVKFTDEQISVAISYVEKRNVQNFLLDALFGTIIKDCLKYYKIKPEAPYEEIDYDWLQKQGFSWESNGIASYLSFRGVRYTKKDEFYAAVNTAFSKSIVR